MRIALSSGSQEMVYRQSGVISRSQALACGMSTHSITNELRNGRWQRLQTGVYATFTGKPDRDAWLWAAVLRAGPGSALSHETAAELHGLADSHPPAASRGTADEPTPHIHICVPADRHPAPMPGVTVHRLLRLEPARHPVLLPQRTRVEDTALDLTQAADSFDDAFGWLARAVGRRLTTAARLRACLETGRAGGARHREPLA